MKTQGDSVHLYTQERGLQGNQAVCLFTYSDKVLLYRQGYIDKELTMGLVQLRLQAGVMLGLKLAFSHLPLRLREKTIGVVCRVVSSRAARTAHAF